MTKPKDLPSVVPVFPLPGALLLPRAQLPLHLFEPRYLAMLDDALKTDARMIAMVQPNDGVDVEDALHRIGCAGRVTAMSETETGGYMITLTGVSRFRIEEEVDGFTPYRRARVNWAGFEDDLGEAQTDPDLDRAGLTDLLKRFFDDRDLSTDWGSMNEAEPELLINSLSILCPFEPEERQALLEADTLKARREMLVTLIEYALHGGNEQKVMQ
ncbi:LON peptidase substrate-binding domain-containing protein [Octadecabacter ascidiaceicola]|uniref:Lon protease 2 n=1 Tax=Octadecabacter ascidiaceicola TaxID=1655543 RepID=A0A238KH53_9RHOB|nr:LON peptidase substrate-binding domain-containing protein [Octadecabacter ascidiaceicola]SMX42028.1 Lon protease 2 [Octadecabacter ascidiaceicola]